MKASYICSLILCLFCSQALVANTFYFSTLKIEILEEGVVADQNLYPHFLGLGETEAGQWRFQWYDPQGPTNVIDLTEPENGNTGDGSYFRFQVMDRTIAYTMEMEIFWNKQFLDDGRFYNCIITLNGEGTKVKFYCKEDKAKVLDKALNNPASASEVFYSHKQLYATAKELERSEWEQYQFEFSENKANETATLSQSLVGRQSQSWQLQYKWTRDMPDSDGKIKLYTYQNGTFTDTLAIIRYPKNKQQDAFEYDALFLISRNGTEGLETDFFFATLDVSQEWNTAIIDAEPVPEPTPKLDEPEPEPVAEPAPKPKKKKKRDRGPLSDTKEVSLTIGKNPYNLVYDAGWLRRIKIGRVGNIQLGLRLGLTQGEGFDFSNVPLSREPYTGPIDSFRMDKWQTHSLNLLAGAELNLGRRLRLGGRLDILGVSGGLFQLGYMVFLDGPDDTGIFLPGTTSLAEGLESVSAPITVTQFGKIWGAAPKGNLAGEVYLRLRVIRGLSLRGGMRFNQYSLTTEEPLGSTQSQAFTNLDQTWFLGLQLHLASDW